MTRRRGVEWIYPDRSRCLRCRNYFGFVVIEDLYCSERCAGLPLMKFPDYIRTVPVFTDGQDLSRWPRQCRNGLRRRFKPKARYQSLEDAQLVAYRRDPWEAVRTAGNGPVRLFYRPDRWPEMVSSPMEVYHCDHCGYFHIGHNYNRPREFSLQAGA